MSFNIRIPYVVATHVKKFTSIASINNKSKASGYGSVNGRLVFNNGVAPLPIDGGSPIVVSAATLALTVAAHANLTAVVFTSLAGCAVTLPAATGSGARFNLFIGASLTSGSFSLAVANAQDFMRGGAYTFVTSTAFTFGTTNTGTVATESDTMTFNRTTTGLGTIGDFIEVIDIAANVWSVEADYASSGTAATPFSAAV